VDARDLFLQQHAAMHSGAVGGNKASTAERVLGGLSDAQMRVRPREDLNSIAWIVWHIARAEDIIVNTVVMARPQVLDDAWVTRLAIARRDFGVGMTSPEVTELTRQIDVDALREYRDAVGRRTREVIGGFRSEDWQGQVADEGVQRAAAEGAFGARAELLTKLFSGRPRSGVLSGIVRPSITRAVPSGWPPSTPVAIRMYPQLAIATSGKVRSPALRSLRSRSHPSGRARTNANAIEARFFTSTESSTNGTSIGRRQTPATPTPGS
jgi:hypothetical protein